MKQVELIVNLNCVIGEGPVYDDQNNILHWIDLLGNKIHSYYLSDGCVAGMELDQNVGAIALRENGGLVGALQNGFYFIDNIHKTWQKIINPETDKPNNRMNDGKCDPKGRFWAGTMSKDLDSGYGEYKPEGSLYCLNADLTVDRKEEGVILSNGLDWSPDGKTFYYIDTPSMEVAAFDFDAETGKIGNKRTVVTIPETLGMPDGMCVDEEGMLWVALWGGKAVSRWDPNTGRLLEKIEVPALNVSSCTFGGKDLNELYITTARIGTDISKYPDAGGLFRVKLGVSGLASNKFRG